MASKRLSHLNAISDDCKMDNSSMIDMVFQLLLFFMVSSHLIEHHKDPAVIIPDAANGKPAPAATGRIVLNIHSDGTFTDELSQAMSDGAAVTDYVRRVREGLPPSAEPQIMIRGHKDAIVKHSKEAVRSAGAAGVRKVVFSVTPRSGS
jgi:biopolymer transport protein ExbD